MFINPNPEIAIFAPCGQPADHLTFDKLGTSLRFCAVGGDGLPLCGGCRVRLAERIGGELVSISPEDLQAVQEGTCLEEIAHRRGQPVIESRT